MSSKKIGFTNGVLQKMVVYDNGAIVGHGYIVILVDGRMSQPTLFDLRGRELEPGWFTIQVTDEKHYVVVPKRIQ